MDVFGIFDDSDLLLGPIRDFISAFKKTTNNFINVMFTGKNEERSLMGFIMLHVRKNLLSVFSK